MKDYDLYLNVITSVTYLGENLPIPKIGEAMLTETALYEVTDVVHDYSDQSRNMYGYKSGPNIVIKVKDITF